MSPAPPPFTSDERAGMGRYGLAVRAALRDRDIRWNEFALFLGCKPDTLRRHCNGESRPTATTVRLFALALVEFGGRADDPVEGLIAELAAASSGALRETVLEGDERVEESWRARARPLEARLLRAARMMDLDAVDECSRRLRALRDRRQGSFPTAG